MPAATRRRRRRRSPTTDVGAIVYENTEEATRTTNDDGTVTFVVDAPRNIKSDKNQDVVDVVTFTVEADDAKTGDCGQHHGQ